MKYSRKDRIKALKILLQETKESEIKGRVIDSPTSKEYKIRHDKSIEENVQSNIPKEILRLINLIKNEYFRHLKTYKIELI